MFRKDFYNNSLKIKLLLCTKLQAFNPDFVSSVKWFVRMVVTSSVVLTLLIAVSVVHQIRLQSLHLLLPLVVSESVAAEPPDKHVVGRGSVEIDSAIIKRLGGNLSSVSG